MKKSLFVIEVEHNKELPPEATDILANRFYAFLMNLGINVTVTAKVWEEAKKDAS